MNKETKKFNQVIKKRMKKAGRDRFERTRKMGVIRKLNKIRNEKPKIKK